MEKHSFKTTNNICTLATKDMTDIGTFFDQGDATTRLTNYFRSSGQSPDDPKLIFGQLFGVSVIRQLLAKIDAFNTDPDNVQQLTGIRIYNAMSLRPGLPAPDNGTLLPDVVIIPVYTDGTDIFELHKLRDPLMTLSGGMPCPNECGTGFYLK